MISTRIAGAVAAGALAVDILAGSEASAMPDWMQPHHAATSPAPTR